MSSVPESAESKLAARAEKSHWKFRAVQQLLNAAESGNTIVLGTELWFHYEQFKKDFMIPAGVAVIRDTATPATVDPMAGKIVGPQMQNLARREFDPQGLAPSAPGAKLDDGKLRAWLCLSGFSNALEEVARVTTVGAGKYSPNGWMQVQNGEQRYMDAFGRHCFALGQGTKIDMDTGCLHKAQMIWNLLASLELELRGKDQEKTRV